jgi:DNA-binding HxlR family transcriptional regulator
VGSELGDPFHSDCPGRRVLDHLTSRWAVLIMSALLHRPHRYHELRTVVEGVSDKMLSQTLRILTADGLIERTVVAGQPIEVTYALTDRGRSASAALQPILDWIRSHAEEIAAGRAPRA